MHMALVEIVICTRHKSILICPSLAQSMRNGCIGYENFNNWEVKKSGQQQWYCMRQAEEKCLPIVCWAGRPCPNWSFFLCMQSFHATSSVEWLARSTSEPAIHAGCQLFSWTQCTTQHITQPRLPTNVTCGYSNMERATRWWRSGAAPCGSISRDSRWLASSEWDQAASKGLARTVT